jgi:hypothetical protein
MLHDTLDCARTLACLSKTSPFKWRLYKAAVILVYVHRDCRYQHSYSEIEEMTSKHAPTLDYFIVVRWILLQYAPEKSQRLRPRRPCRSVGARAALRVFTGSWARSPLHPFHFSQFPFKLFPIFKLAS